MNIFFCKQVGPGDAMTVRVAVGYEGLRHLVTIDPDLDDGNATPFHLTPEQAQQLGRALIKAGKMAAKSKVYGVLHITNADRRAFDTVESDRQNLPSLRVESPPRDSK